MSGLSQYGDSVPFAATELEFFTVFAQETELQLLKQAYKVSKLPCAFGDLSLLDESQNVRKGKFAQAEVMRLLIALPKYLADVAEFAYETGARAGEILKLRWSYLRADAIEVPASDTKSRKSRSIAITDKLAEIIVRRRKAHVQGCDLIFHNDGHSISDYRKAWQSACVLNGLGTFYCRTCCNDVGEYDSTLDAQRKCPRCERRWDVPLYVGRIMHDFRRTAAHEMWKAGSTVDECMEVTGHATAAMFKRYADLFSEDERRAMQRKVQERRHIWREEEIGRTTVRAGTLAN